ncbi:MAG: hypothetical protein DMG12_10785 [Acidobacteria bacterium]|nr:MAG: hypothetical protein DMG12_10785 [Acidobacteriota bacterium]
MLFWDIRVADFDPKLYPEYTIARILELGNPEAVSWLQQNFTEEEIIKTIRSERRLSPKSANYWALIYRIPAAEVAALR